MKPPRDPSLYQINTRVWLTALSQGLGRPATLDDIPDAELDRLAAAGFDWVWLFLAFLLDIGHLAGSGYANRERAGGFYSGGSTS